MYEQFYGLSERPFSITPDPRFVFLSPRHEDALAHLLYGIGRGGSGGFVQLTGEVGTGKTTLCRLLLDRVPERTRIALVLNPMLEPRELLRAVCRELEVDMDDSDGSLEDLGQRLNRRLLDIHAAGERAVLIIDEAQNMSRETLEQVRLLTNLETSTDKLLQIILLGQPELRELLARPSLRQLAQRITARYHLTPLAPAETAEYVRHRIAVAGAPRCPFTAAALRTLHHVSGGVPRLINIVADRALMAGYARETAQIHPALVRQAAAEVVVGDESEASRGWSRGLVVAALALVLAVSAGTIWSLNAVPNRAKPQAAPSWSHVLDAARAEEAWREAAALLPGVAPAQVARACLEGGRGVVTCHRLSGNWSLLQWLERPVILRLHGADDGLVTVSSVSGQEAALSLAGQAIRIPRAQIESRWRGEFLVAWPDSGAVLAPGDRSDDVAAVKTRAARVPVSPWGGGVSRDYGPDFERWVRGFQRRHGLTEDGVAGPVTRLFLAREALPEPPADPPEGD